MASYKKWKVDFDANESAIVAKKHVSDPPGFESSSSGRDVVSFQSITLSDRSIWRRKGTLAHCAAGHDFQRHPEPPTTANEASGAPPTLP